MRMPSILQLILETEDTVYSPVRKPEEKPWAGPGLKWKKALLVLALDVAIYFG